MKEQDGDEPLPERDRGNQEDGRSGSSPQSTTKEPAKPADRAVENQEQALESGEENVI